MKKHLILLSVISWSACFGQVDQDTLRITPTFKYNKQFKEKKYAVALPSDDVNSELFKLKRLEYLDASHIKDKEKLKKLATESKNLQKLVLDVEEKNLVSSSGLEAAVFYRSIGEEERSLMLFNLPNDLLYKPISGYENSLFQLKPWEYTGISIGYVDNQDTNVISIKSITSINTDLTLQNDSVDVTLDAIYLEDYPRNGRNLVLFECSAENNIFGNQSEQLKFILKQTIAEKNTAGVISAPIFRRINLGSRGISFEFKTILVANENDENFLEILEGDETGKGLKLLNSINPVIPVFTEIAKGIATKIAKNNRNKEIQSYKVGLDFSPAATKAKIREGSYVVVQVQNPALINWNDYKYDKNKGAVVSTVDNTKILPYNHFVFSIARPVDQ